MTWSFLYIFLFLLKFFAQDSERSLQTVQLHALKSGVSYISAWFFDLFGSNTLAFGVNYLEWKE